MRVLKTKDLYRILDANLNRSKEALRVLEDTARFMLDHPGLTSQYKKLRHQLTAIVEGLSLKALIQARNIEGDVGKRSIFKELKRTSAVDIFYANSQRLKESVRVLEEFSKLFNKRAAQQLKEVRYKIYALEKKMASAM